jgi:hypothetical protein
MTFPWDTALASGLGAASGAAAAFLFNLMIERIKETDKRKLAGHVALAMLSTKLADLDRIVSHWRKAHEDTGPFWWQFHAPVLIPEDTNRINIESLGFLLQRGYLPLIRDVRDAEQVYFEFTSILRQYQIEYLTALIPAMHAADIPDSMTSVEAIGNERKLPRPIVQRLEDLHHKLEIRVENAPGVIRKTAQELRTALDGAFWRASFPSPTA